MRQDTFGIRGGGVHFWEKGEYTVEDTMTGESHEQLKQFWSADWGGSEPRGHHGLAPSDKCHCNFDACVFAPILQNSSLDQKKKKKFSPVNLAFA